MTTKIPPHNIDIEKATIGVMILYPEEDYSSLSVEDFYDPPYAIIAREINRMKAEGIPIDLITIYDNVKQYQIDVTMLTELTTGIYTVANLPQYIKTLKDYRRKRESIRIGTEIIHLADGDASKMVDYANKLSMASTIGMEGESSVSYDDVTSAYEMIASRIGKSLYGYSWGDSFGFLDNITKGIVKPRVYRVAAPSNTGKTQFVYNIIPTLLEQKNEDGTYVKIAFFTLENTKEDTLVSIMCNKFGLDASKVNKGEEEGDWDYLTSLKNRLYIIDNIYEVDKIFSKVISIKPDIVILDYISHITVAKAQGMEKYDIYAEKVPKFAKSQNIAWIDLSNLPKNLQTNDEIRASPGFYGSSLLFNNCDVSFHLMRNEQFKKTKESILRTDKSTREDRAYFFSRACNDLLVSKNRWGSVFETATYGINFNTGGKWNQLSEDDLNRLWAKYG